MNGQWIGDYKGATEGELLMNIDDCKSHFEGVAYLTPHNSEIPSVGLSFRTDNKDREFKFVPKQVWPIHPHTANNLGSFDEVNQFYPSGFLVAKEIEVTGHWNESQLEVEYRTEKFGSGSAKIPRSRSSQPSELYAQSMEWADFKKYVAGLVGRRDLFRGQSEPWRLRTRYHRNGRADLRRFTSIDIPILHRRLSARTRHIFELSKPEQNGAFFNLLQHHGYPTPLLDWTSSPYIAAFFAFRGVPKKVADANNPGKNVRIFVLNDRWKSDIPQLVSLDRPFLHFSVAEFIAIENERTIPQQSISTATNVDDIESFIKEKGISRDQTYLSAIDLPSSERNQVIHELNYMGLTAGSLFPGLDGDCEELTELNF